MRIVKLADFPPESLDDLVRNVEGDLVLEWSQHEAHLRALLDCNLDDEDEDYLSSELCQLYFEDDETVVAAFHSWLVRR